MKKIIILLSIVLFLGLFLASPYILDYWQNKSALEAAGGMAVYEGMTQFNPTKCTPDCCDVSGCKCCQGGTNCKPSDKMPCLATDLQVTLSAGGITCPTGYLLTTSQASMVNGSQNVIIGGTMCTSLQVVASERGCDGCTAAINNSKVYAFKSKLKSITDFIIAGFKDKIK